MHRIKSELIGIGFNIACDLDTPSPFEEEGSQCYLFIILLLVYNESV